MGSTVGREEYAAFIGQVELSSIWLVSCSTQNLIGPDSPRNAMVEIEHRYHWEASEAGFDAFAKYRLRITRGASELGSVEAVFGLAYQSSTPMTEELFELFSELNLPVNAWPFMREFASTTISRFGWVPFTLPTMKRGTRKADQAGKAEAHKSE